MGQGELERNLLRLDIEPISDLPFDVGAALRALPRLRTVAYAGSAVRISRTRTMAADGD
jgi:hypothetical protein